MNRFEYLVARLQGQETFVSKALQIKLYDGEQKTQFEDGELVLTTHRLFWGHPGDIAQAAICLCLQLKYIVSISEEQASNYLFGRKTRVILHLRPPTNDKQPGPLDNSKYSFIKLSGKNGISTEFINALKETYQAKIWEVKLDSNNESKNIEDNVARAARLRMRTGIGGIERAIAEKTKETDDNIALAFQDLRVLMGMAKDMVAISQSISNKIRTHKEEISSDETVRFKSYLLSLGIEDPVTRDGFATDTDYYRSLAEELCNILLDPLEACGGMMSMAEVYCRVNRSRGLQLLSPEDLLNACRLLSGPIKLRTFPSGAMILQLESQNDDVTACETLDLVKEHVSVAVEDLAKLKNISLLLAKEQLLAAELLGKLCRDESMEGLRFYPNFILDPPQAAS